MKESFGSKNPLFNVDPVGKNWLDCIYSESVVGKTPRVRGRYKTEALLWEADHLLKLALGT